MPGYLMGSAVGVEDIDWIATLATYAHPDWGGEEEIVLKPAAAVRIETLHRREGWLRRVEAGADEAIPLERLETEFFQAQAGSGPAEVRDDLRFEARP